MSSTPIIYRAIYSISIRMLPGSDEMRIHFTSHGERQGWKITTHSVGWAVVFRRSAREQVYWGSNARSTYDAFMYIMSEEIQKYKWENE
jgi:hypothetical protein